MVNRMTIIGRIGKDPEFRVSQGGSPVCRFSVATTEKWKDKQTGEAKEETEWHRALAFGRLAETIRDYCFKGQLVYLEGKMHYDKYENKEGHTVYTAEVNVQKVDFLSYRDKDESGSGSAPQPAQQYKDSPGFASDSPARRGPAADTGGGFEDDDLPF